MSPEDGGGRTNKLEGAYKDHLVPTSAFKVAFDLNPTISSNDLFNVPVDGEFRSFPCFGVTKGVSLPRAEISHQMRVAPTSFVKTAPSIYRRSCFCCFIYTHPS